MISRTKPFVALVGVLAAAVLAGPADARTFTVDSPQDQGDQNTTDGICDTDNFGCTLRAAVEQADAFVDDPSDTIVVRPALTTSATRSLPPPTCKSSALPRGRPS